MIDPEEGAVRLAMFAAMAGFLVAAVCVPQAFEDLGLTFALAYGVVRAAHIVLFVLASRQDVGLRRSVLELAISTTIGVGLLALASTAEGTTQGALWALALLLDMGGPIFIDPSGWRLDCVHFAERHGLIIIIALGESIVALGAAAANDVNGGVLVAAVTGVALSAGLWWLYFDVVSYVASQALVETVEVRARNTLARDAYSYLHFPLCGGIVLAAFGLHEVLAHIDEPLAIEPSAALFGGVATYLLAHVAFAWRCTGSPKVHRWAMGVLVGALVPVGTEIDGIWSLLLVTALVVGLIVYENIRFAESRLQIRRDLAHGHH